MSELSADEAEAVALLISSAIVRRYGKALREDGARDPEAVEALALLAGAVALPVLRTFLLEDDAIKALDEIDALEGFLTE